MPVILHDDNELLPAIVNGLSESAFQARKSQLSVRIELPKILMEPPIEVRSIQACQAG